MTAFSEAMGRGLLGLYRKMGEPGRHTASDGYCTDCLMIVDRDMSVYGEIAEINAQSVVISICRSELFTKPQRGELIELDNGCETFRVDRLISSDELEYRFIAA